MSDLDSLIDAATAGSSESQIKLARRCLKINKYDDAVYWFKRAADSGDSYGSNGLACCYLKGYGVELDREKARELFQKAADMGCDLAQYNLVSIFKTGKEPDVYLKYASAGNQYVCYKLGRYYMRRHLGEMSWQVVSERNTEKAFNWFLKSAEKGYHLSQYEVGLFYEKGVDPCIRNLEKACCWFEKSAEQGNAKAMLALGRIYANGIDDLTPDYDKAYYYYLMAAQNGEEEAQFRVGVALKYGRGAQIDKEKAYSFFVKAAEQGHAEAQYYVALSLAYGEGVSRDLNAAIEWLKKTNSDDFNFKNMELLSKLENDVRLTTTEASPKDILEGIMDAYGVLYSKDGKKLLRYAVDDNYETYDIGHIRQQTLNDYIVSEGVEIICDGAFEDCESLQTINLPNSVKSIGKGAFSNCTNLESINIPEGIEVLSDYTFEGCTSLVDICLPSSLDVIGDQALKGVPKLRSLSPNLIVKDGCLLSHNLKTLIHYFNDEREYFILPLEIEDIAPYAFWRSRLNKVIIHSKVRRIGDFAFERCENLGTVKFETFNGIAHIETIGHCAFAGCNHLTDIVLPNGLEVLGIQTFDYCHSLRNVILPNTLKEIGNCAFEGTSLESIELPESLVDIGIMTFVGSPLQRLTSSSPKYKVRDMMIYNEDETILLQYYGNDNIVRVKDSVIEIGDYAFACAWSIKELIIPNTVKKFGKDILHQVVPSKITVPKSLYEEVKGSVKDYYRERIIIDNKI